MNKVYKSVWNESIGAWVAVSETAAARGKRNGRLAKAVAASVVTLGAASGAIAGNADKYLSANDAYSSPDGATAIGVGSIAIGGNAVADSTGGVNAAMAIGSDSMAGTQATALGPGATASAPNSVALGTLSIADRVGTVSVGNATNKRQIVNVAAGTQANDAINVGQLTPIISALGGTAAFKADGSFTAPTYKVKGKTFSNVGDALAELDMTPTDNKYLAINSTLASATAAGTESVAIGGAAAANSHGDISIGSNSSATGNSAPSGSAVAIGTNASANAAQALALGTSATATANGDVAIGTLAQASGAGAYGSATALGFSTIANGKLASAIGYRATATGENSIALGANSVADVNNTVSVGSATNQRRVVNVAAGTQANDAVNVTQLQNVTTLLGGGAKINSDGTVQAPVYTVAGVTSGTVGDAIIKIDSELTNKVAYDTADKLQVTLGGAGAGNPTKLTNLKIGDLSSSSTDAINGSQLYSTNQRVSTLETFEGNINNGGGIKYFHSNSTLADSSATGADSVAIGGAALSSGKNSVALGSNSVADRDNAVSVGAVGSERQVTNVAAGTAATDAANVGQLNAVSSSVTSLSASAIKYDTNADGTPDYANATLGNGNATGTALHNVAAGTSAMDAVNLGQINDMIGQVTNIANNAYNPLFTADGDRNTEVATSSGSHSVASGANAMASGVNAIASGSTSVASGANAVALGANTSATANNAVAVGANASATANNSVALGAGSLADRANAVSVGTTAAGGQRQVTNVAAGTDGTDAVNVNQMQQSVNTGVKSAKGYTDALRSDMNSGLSLANNHINSVGAMSSAMAMMAGSAAAIADKDNRFAAGTGVYRDKAAIAIGFQKRFGTNMVLTIGGSTTGEETTGGAGFAFGF